MVSEDLVSKKLPERGPDFIMFIVYTRALSYSGDSIIDDVRVEHMVFNELHE